MTSDDWQTMTRSHRAFLFLPVLLLAAYASAQAKPQLTLATVLARGPALTASLPRVLWLPEGHEAMVILTSDAGEEALHPIVNGQPAEPAWFTASELLAALPKAPKPDADNDKDAKPKRFPPMRFVAEDTVRVEFRNAIWHWQVGTQAAVPVLPNGDPNHTLLEVSPTDSHTAVRSEQQLVLLDRKFTKHQLTWDGSDDVVIADAAHRAEIGITKGTFWRADGRYLAFYREDQRQIREYPYQDVLAIPPLPRHGRYPMAGHKHSRVQVLVCNTDTYEVLPLASDATQDVYWTNVTFGPNDTIFVTLVNRGQDQLELVRFDLKTGKRRNTVLREHDQEWIEPEHPPTFLADGRFLWWSSRSGYRHLYLYEADGTLLRPITNGNFDVQELLQVSSDEQRVFVQAAGNDPRQLHLFAASLAASPSPPQVQMQQLTIERGTHTITLSPDSQFAADIWSNLETPPTTRILNLQTGALTKLPASKDPLAEFALPKQQFFEVQADDGATLYGHIAYPEDIQAGQRLPVIHYVYGGPHVQLVKDSWFGGAALWLQALASEGYVVCRLDNHGTPNRGIEFEQAVHRHLGTIEVKDQLRAIDWLQQQTFVDPTRIGVHGWSFGGYMTLRLMLLHPEVFACGISGAPVTDWAMYETGYGERYMDTPQENPDGYLASSCLPIAGNLRRPLLLVHGTDDRTVMWSHTLQFVDACVAAGVDLDYFPYPQQLHGLRGVHRKHFQEKLRGYFGRNLRPEDRGEGK